MSAAPGRQASMLREFNRQRILAALRELDRASRGDLERATGLSRGTVASIVAELCSEGTVRPADGPDPRSGAQGRPPALLTLASPTGLALAVDIGHGHVRVAVGDAGGVVVEERFSELPSGPVSFYLDGVIDTAHLLGTSSLEPTGTARITVRGGIAAGSHTVAAIYAGDTRYNASTSGEAAFTVVASH